MAGPMTEFEQMRPAQGPARCAVAGQAKAGGGKNARTACVFAQYRESARVESKKGPARAPCGAEVSPARVHRRTLYLTETKREFP